MGSTEQGTACNRARWGVTEGGQHVSQPGASGRLQHGRLHRLQVGRLQCERHHGVQVKWHNWWSAPQTMAHVQKVDPVASHASWMENFPWTRLPGITMPDHQKPMMPIARFQQLDPVAKKQLLGDGNYGGLYQRPDEDMLAIWKTAVAETRAVILQNWA